MRRPAAKISGAWPAEYEDDVRREKVEQQKWKAATRRRHLKHNPRWYLEIDDSESSTPAEAKSAVTSHETLAASGIPRASEVEKEVRKQSVSKKRRERRKRAGTGKVTILAQRGPALPPVRPARPAAKTEVPRKVSAAKNIRRHVGGPKEGAEESASSSKEIAPLSSPF